MGTTGPVSSDVSAPAAPATPAAAVVVGGGPIRVPVRAYDLVIAADSGLDVALDAGFTPTHLVGDLDSISDAGTAWAAANGVPVDRHPADKDDTDTALALASAVALGARSIDLYGGTGVGRLDHLLGTLAALGDPGLATMRSVTAYLDDTTVHVLHPGRSVDLGLDPEAVFSLVALHGECRGVDVVGARWPLHQAHLRPGSTRGISNTSTGVVVQVSVASGVLTVIVPGAPPKPSVPVRPSSPDAHPQEHS